MARSTVASAAYTVAVPYTRLEPALGTDVRLAGIRVHGDVATARRSAVSVLLPRGQKRLPFDHDEIVRRAVADLHERYRALTPTGSCTGRPARPDGSDSTRGAPDVG